MVRTTWSELESALRLRPPPGWRRLGQEWGGPCPLSGAGDTKAWAGRGRDNGIVLGCRSCAGGSLGRGQLFKDHLMAILGGAGVRVITSTRSSSTPAQVSTRPEPASTAPADVWTAAVDPAGTPAEHYLVGQRHVWPPDVRMPPSVRWLPREAAETVLIRDRSRRYPASVYLEKWAAGAVCYRYAKAGEAGTMAVQVESVDATGRRGRLTGPKRRSVKHTDCAGGQRVFEALAGDSGSRSWSLCEGPADALAVARLSLAELCGADRDGAVVAVPGATMLAAAAAAVPPGRVVTMWVQRDGPGLRAATGAGVRCRVVPGPAGADWADAVRRELRDELVEREAMRDG